MNPIQYFFHRINNSCIYQGKYKKNKYFEGWYFRIISKEKTQCIFIVGVSLLNKDKHAFIQFINGQTNTMKYYRFPLSQFSYSDSTFEIKIGNNYFSQKRVEINLDEVVGIIFFNEIIQYPKTKLSPNIMGFFSYIPFMQCYHAIVTVDSKSKGYLFIEGERMNLNQGQGYIEKDYGRRFPKEYIWHLSNQFHHHQAVCMNAIATIPFGLFSFKGFLGFLYFNHQFYRFSTYNFSRIIKTPQKALLKFKKRRYLLTIDIIPSEGIVLSAPSQQGMDSYVKETIHTKSSVSLVKGKNVLFEDESELVCFEMGNID